MRKVIPTILTLGSLTFLNPSQTYSNDCKPVQTEEISKQESKKREQTKRNYIYSGLPKNEKIYLELNPGSNVDLTEFLKIKVRKGKPSYDVIPTQTALENIQSYIGARGLPCIPCKSNSTSVKSLDKLVQDGIINENDSLFVNGRKIENGNYTIMVRSQPIKNSKRGNVLYTGESVPIFVEVTTKTPEKEKPHKRIFNFTRKEKKREEKPKEKPTPVELFVDGFAGGNNTKGVRAGIQVRRFGALASYSQSGDEKIREATCPLSAGRYATGEEKHKNFSSFGILGEFHPSKYLLVGAGPVLHIYTEQTNTDIISPQGESLDPQSGSKAKKELSAQFHGGVKFPVKGFNARVSASYDSKHGGGLGIGVSIPLSKKHSKQKIPHKKDHRRGRI